MRAAAIHLVPAVMILGCGYSRVGESKTAPPSEGPTEIIAEATWLRPAPGRSADPVWGTKHGLAVGLWPAPGPRGLIRIYAPYLGQSPGRAVNFISIEPVVKGIRGQSELETGNESKETGLAIWTGDSIAEVSALRGPTEPTPGRVEHRDGTEVLTFFLATEPFRNGAKPILEVILRIDRPREVGFRIHAAKDSVPIDSCVLSATMGNYGRLRRLWLRGEVVDARKLWPVFQPDALGFAPWRSWGSERLFKREQEVLVAATSDEADLTGAPYDPDLSAHWRYEGKPATHYWRTADVAGLVVRVNGRTTYWGNGGKIPGGIAYENFELEAPFAEGQEFWFGVTPEEPSALGFDAEWGRNITDGR